MRFLDVDSRDASAAFLQRRIVSRRLRTDQPAEAERLVRDRELVTRIVDDLQEEAGVRAALVQLTSGYQPQPCVTTGACIARADQTAIRRPPPRSVDECRTDVVALLRLQAVSSIPSGSTSAPRPAHLSWFAQPPASSGWPNDDLERTPQTAPGRTRREFRTTGEPGTASWHQPMRSPGGNEPRAPVRRSIAAQRPPPARTDLVAPLPPAGTEAAELVAGCVACSEPAIDSRSRKFRDRRLSASGDEPMEV
jgi:hypothetical protein